MHHYNFQQVAGIKVMNHYPDDDTETIADDKSIRVLKKNLCIALLAQVSNLHKKEFTSANTLPHRQGA